MRNASLWLSILLAGSTLFGQNLVPNGSFEDYSSCPPTSISAQGRIDLLNNWFIPSGGGTPDFFSSCHIPYPGWPSVDVPNNTWGSQNARTGSCYAGFAPAAEYIEIQLLAPLTAGETYDFEMYVSMGEEAQRSTDGLGVFFSDGPVAAADGWGNAQINNGVFNFITATSGWVLIAGSYTAAGGEDHITIGNFFSSFFPVSNPAGTMALSYYFIDDVSLVQQIVLPVDFISVKSEFIDDHVQVSWTTSFEENNAYFVLERSYDGKSYRQIGTVEGAGNSSVARNYQLTDQEVEPGQAYYRIRQVDFNGSSSLSEPVSVYVPSEHGPVTVFPNPIRLEGTIRFHSLMSQRLTVRVYNSSGILIYSENAEVQKGNNLIRLSAGEFASGFYQILVEQENNWIEAVQFFKL